MQAYFRKPFLKTILVFIILSLATSFGCAVEDGNDPNQLIDKVSMDFNQFYLELARESISAWGIELDTNLFGTQRNITPNHIANPPNWITVANKNCDSKGIPEDIQNICSLKHENIIGVCYTRTYTSGSNVGEIVDTTVIVKESVLTDTNRSIAKKKTIFIHEIGHCLGLQHWGNTSKTDSGLEPKRGNNNDQASHIEWGTHIMYPSEVNPSDETNNPPAAEELAAVAAIYKGQQCRSGNNLACQDPLQLSLPVGMQKCNLRDEERNNIDYDLYKTAHRCYYSQVGSSTSRSHHAQFPKFYISGGIGKHFQTEEEVPPGPLLKGDFSKTIYFMKSDGGEEIHRSVHRQP